MEHNIELHNLSRLGSLRFRRKAPFGIRDKFFEKYDNRTFIQRFRLSKKIVSSILDKIEHRIRHNTERNRALSPLEMLLLALRFYASGSFVITVADFYGVSVATASRVVRKVSIAVAELSAQYIQMPKSTTQLESTTRSFHNLANFPKVVGCIDCTHVKIQSPGGENAEIFRNRKGYFSYNVQAVCDADLVIRDIVCRWPGSAHDSNIFNNSRINNNNIYVTHTTTSTNAIIGSTSEKQKSETSFHDIVKASGNYKPMTSKQIEKDLLPTLPRAARYLRPKISTFMSKNQYKSVQHL